MNLFEEQMDRKVLTIGEKSGTAQLSWSDKKNLICLLKTTKTVYNTKINKQERLKIYELVNEFIQEKV